MKSKLIISLSFASLMTMFLFTGFVKYSLVTVLTFCVFYLQNFKVNISKQTAHIIRLYGLYILFEFISLVIENSISNVILTNILARHYISVLILLNLSCLNTHNFNYVLRLFFIFTAISCVFSILQFIQVDFALDMHKTLYPSNDRDMAMQLSDIKENNFAFYGYPGLYQNLVLSAQYSSTFLMFSFFYFVKKKWIRLFFVVTFVAALLSMQIRSGVYSSLFVLLGYVFFFYRKYFIIVLAPFLVYAVITINSLIGTIDLRILDASSSIREVVNENFWSYVSEGNFLGKREYFASRNNYLEQQDITTPHQILKNAYVLAGLPGLIVTVIIVTKIVRYRLKNVYEYKHDYVHKAAIFCYLVSAFTHNNSFHFGDCLMFIVLLSHEKN